MEDSMEHSPETLNAEINRRIGIGNLLEALGSPPGRTQETADRVCACCPIHHEDLFKNLIIDKRTRTFRCTHLLCEGAEGGDLIRLYALARRIPYDEAAALLARMCGVQWCQPDDKATLRHSLSVAASMLESGHRDEALGAYRDLLMRNPNEIRARRGLVKAAIECGDREEAARQYEALARHDLAAGRPKDALRSAIELVTLRPDWPQAHLLAAESACATGDRQAALEAFMAAADAHEGLRQYDEALEAYLQAEALDLEIVDLAPHILRCFSMAGGVTGRSMSFLLAQAEQAALHQDCARAARIYSLLMRADPSRSDWQARFAEVAGMAVPVGQWVPRVLEIADRFFGAGRDGHGCGHPAQN